MAGGDLGIGEKRCFACGAQSPAGARFCVGCGNVLEEHGCRACGAPLVPGGGFCPSCGHAVVDGAADDTPPEERSRTVGAPPDLGLAERRRVSILFVDLVDSTSIAEGMDPEEVRAVQARYFEVARSIVTAHGGTIEKFIGDAVMAVWGAPAAHEDDAERAVRAARAIVDAVARLGGAAASRTLRARAAVTTGEAAVTVGAIDQGIVAGDLVNVAARLQGRASAGGVVVDRATRDATTEVATYARMGRLALRGRSGRLETYRLDGLRATAGSARHASHAGRMIGRDRVLHELTGLVQDTIDGGHGRLVSVAGIAGIGKSRVAWELQRWMESHPGTIAWHEGRAVAYGEGIAFHALAQMVRRRAQVEDGTPPELARRLLGSALAEVVRDEAERRWMEPRVAALVVPEGDERFDRDELFAAWRRFFERVSELMPVVMVFEDLHWADPGLLDFIEHLATWSRSRPIFILTLARPELLDRRPTWAAMVGRFTATTLERLPDEAMRELLADRAPGLDDDLVESVLARSGGVPLYAVEVARMLTDRGSDREQRLGEGDVPDSLHGVIAARLDAVPTAERRLLMAAAVLGSRFRLEALQAVTGEAPGDLLQRLERLVHGEMLAVDDELGSPGRGQMAFVQELVREVAYRTLARAERRALHLAAARHFESGDVDLPDALAAHLVAAHRLTASPRDASRLARRAVSALRRAARGAMTLHAAPRADALLDTALDLADARTRAGVLSESAEAARAAGHLERAAARLRELAEHQAQAGERSEAARTEARLASVLLAAQLNQPALQALEAALDRVPRWERDPAGVELAAQLARAHSVMGDDGLSVHWADRALPAAEQLGLEATSTELRITRATARLGLGAQEAGLADLRSAIDEANGAGLLRAELRARNNLAWGLLGDDPAAAGAVARAGLDLATDMGIGDFVIPLADLACSAAVETGAWDWALATIDEIGGRGADGAYGAVLATAGGVIHALRGSPDAAAELDRLAELPRDTDAQILAVVGIGRTWTRFLGQDLDGARELADAAVTDAMNLPLHELALAVRVRVWQGDGDGASAMLAELSGGSRWGRATKAARATMEAGVSALRGDAAAAARYREARDAWQELGLPLQRVLCMMDQHRLLPRTIDRRMVADAIAELGADGLLPLARPRPRDAQTRTHGSRARRSGADVPTRRPRG